MIETESAPASVPSVTTRIARYACWLSPCSSAAKSAISTVYGEGFVSTVRHRSDPVGSLSSVAPSGLTASVLSVLQSLAPVIRV